MVGHRESNFNSRVIKRSCGCVHSCRLRVRYKARNVAERPVSVYISSPDFELVNIAWLKSLHQMSVNVGIDQQEICVCCVSIPIYFIRNDI